MEDIERVKEGYWEKLLITAISMIICVGPEKSIIPDISLLWLFKKKSQTDKRQFFL